MTIAAIHFADAYHPILGFLVTLQNEEHAISANLFRTKLLE
jgi:hypothetical protein